MNQHEKAPQPHTGAALRLSYTVFCDRHSGAWLGLACAMLHDEGRALRVVDELKRQLQLRWGAVLAEEQPAAEAYKLLNTLIADAVVEAFIETGRLPRSPQDDRAECIRHFVERARDELGHLGGRQEVAEALRRLTERQRAVVVLRHLLAFEYSMIAEYLDTTETNVRTTYHQAVRKLRRLLGVQETASKE
ncbi:sigma factor-like helix-turn-helix DNA-binding protein [Kitasatospora sp. NPDC059795]|uniref:sigma factor-like helix-turn-helix DNA-binding protein n=1 Tax=Kitasatospora sp. NPDC059795 TaxID=3346949 RepID=UPI0036535C81